MFSLDSLVKMALPLISDSHVDKFKQFVTQKCIEYASNQPMLEGEIQVAGMVFLDQDNELRLTTCAIAEAEGKLTISRIIQAYSVDDLVHLFKKHKDDLK